MLDITASYHWVHFQGKRMIQTQENDKTHFGPDLGPLDPKFGPSFFFKKLMILSWENLVTDGRTDRQTDKSDFIGQFPTNAERPICKLLKTPYGFLMFSWGILM